MNINKLKLESPDYPERLRHIPSPPKALYCLGVSLIDLLKRPAVAIVGSRQISPYGEIVTADLARGLAEQGFVIVSGLALGTDAVAHRTALRAGAACIAVLPSPVDNVVPMSHRSLAQQILNQGGAIISEYVSGIPPQKQNFIARNRIMSGLADAVIITEAGLGSGALHTASFADQQNRPVYGVPGNVNMPGWQGTNSLLKSNRAGVITDYTDLLSDLQLKFHALPAQAIKGSNPSEQKLLDLILQGVNDGFALLERSQLTASQFNQTLTMLEISGKIRPLGSNHWAIA